MRCFLAGCGREGIDGGSFMADFEREMGRPFARTDGLRLSEDITAVNGVEMFRCGAPGTSNVAFRLSAQSDNVRRLLADGPVETSKFPAAYEQMFGRPYVKQLKKLEQTLIN